MVSAETLTIEILDVIFFIFSIISFFISLKIYLNWDINSTKPLQYHLEKLSFLTQTVIKYIFVFKIPLFLFFIFTLDKISNVITGAMCAVGVVNATEVGIYLLVLKIINIYLFGFWLLLNSIDTQNENLPYTKTKFGIYLFLFFLLLAEIAMEIYMFNTLDVSKLVSCCGTVFSSSSSSLISNIFSIDTKFLLVFFYANFLLLFITKRFKVAFGVLNLSFLVISLISLILFFSTYVYELPTHHCPFCILQKEYHYIGYLFYTFLFTGTFFGISYALFNIKRYAKLSLLFNSLYVVSVSFYPLYFFIKNGVWL